MRAFSSFLIGGCLVFGAAALQAAGPKPAPLNSTSFLLTCEDCHIREDGFLNCKCKTKKQEPVDSSLNVSEFAFSGSVSNLWKDMSEKIQNCDGALVVTDACLEPTPKK